MAESPEPHQTDTGRRVYTVSRLNREARMALEGHFSHVWVEGEVSNLARPRSGHLYFSLKDSDAQVRCAMFRTRSLLLDFQPEDGIHVLVRARTGIYEPRGDFQLVVEYMEQAGDGALQRAFEALKHRLAAEGLFETGRKRPLPMSPRIIGIVTSPTGAAVRDILSILRRRFPAIEVVIYPVPVQGPAAAPAIADAIRRAGDRKECDVLVVGRGGGSLEDLWAFNEEVVARAIHACPLPVVSAVGHEIDFTIADFVADQRAPTPSAAAELLAPDRDAWLARLGRWRQRLIRSVQTRMEQETRHLQICERRLIHPGRRLEQIGQRLDELEKRLANAWKAAGRHRVAYLAELRARLHRRSPEHRIERHGQHLLALAHRLRAEVRRKLEAATARLTASARALDGVSPLATLGRGYAIVTRETDDMIVRFGNQVSPGERVAARLFGGKLHCRVEEVEND